MLTNIVLLPYFRDNYYRIVLLLALFKMRLIAISHIQYLFKIRKLMIRVIEIQTKSSLNRYIRGNCYIRYIPSQLNNHFHSHFYTHWITKYEQEILIERLEGFHRFIPVSDGKEPCNGDFLKSLIEMANTNALEIIHILRLQLCY